jgi:hypothetical protein
MSPLSVRFTHFVSRTDKTSLQKVIAVLTKEIKISETGNCRNQCFPTSDLLSAASARDAGRVAGKGGHAIVRAVCASALTRQ